MCVQIRIGIRGFNFKEGDIVEHFNVTHTTRGILQDCPGPRRMARYKWMSSEVVRVSSRLRGEISFSSLEDVAQGNLGEVGITTAELIAWRARR